MIRPVLLSLIFVLSGTAYGATFKCVDASGKTTYADAPCEGATRAQKKMFDSADGPAGGGSLDTAKRNAIAALLAKGCIENRSGSPEQCRCIGTEFAARAGDAEYQGLILGRLSERTFARLEGLSEAAARACSSGGSGAAAIAGNGGAAAKSRPDAGSPFDTGDASGKAPSGTLAGTGTGFFVGAVGHVVTNAHVAGQCRQLKAKHATGEVVDLKLIATDSKNDLALLKGVFISPVAGPPFRGQDPPLGEAVVVFGFPLSNILAASGNITNGTLSGLAGLHNDPARYQISAPVQPGNSGGALLDEGGLVIGVVQSKLDAARVQAIKGDLPQNVNFAIKGRIVLDFLAANKIGTELKNPQPPRKVSLIAQDATRFTLLIGCFR